MPPLPGTRHPGAKIAEFGPPGCHSARSTGPGEGAAGRRGRSPRLAFGADQVVVVRHQHDGVAGGDAEERYESDHGGHRQNAARHVHSGEDNGDAHLKSLLVHHQVILPITAGRLDLGPWQQVYYAEFDGMRRKRVILKVMGE